VAEDIQIQTYKYSDRQTDRQTLKQPDIRMKKRHKETRLTYILEGRYTVEANTDGETYRQMTRHTRKMIVVRVIK
jgi:hypothetical protein